MKNTNQNLKQLAVATSLLLFSIPAFCQQTNFTGNWQLNKSKTDFKQTPEWALPRALKVMQSKKALMVDRTMLTNTLAEKHYSENILFDGASSVTTTAMGNKETDSLTRSSDKTHLMLKILIVNPSGQPLTNSIEEWSLVDGGKTLLVDRQVEQGDGSKYELKAYFDKQ